MPVYKKIHRRLALVFTSIPSLILVLMSAAFLSLSEKALYENSFLNFSREMDTIVSYLEQQDVISYEWLAKISDNGKYLPAIYDQGILLSYAQTALSRQEQQLLFQAAQLEPVASLRRDLCAHKEFTYVSSQKEMYYICAASIQANGTLTALILHTPETVTRQIKLSRGCFLLLNAAGIILLFFFSWHYTKRLLSPIQKSQEAQAAFIAAASHELRTPLSVIQSCASAVRNAPCGEQPRFLAAIEKESRRMSRLVTDLLTLSRADSHTLHMCIQETELDTVLLDAYEHFCPLAGKKQISMHIELAQDLFPTCLCDGERIAQLLGILISNAISYQNPGGFIKLSLAYENGTFIFRVADHGIGISNGAKAHIFERFYRADASRSRQEHLGLGLSIAKEIADAHQAGINVQDAPGGGTVFTVRLPG